MKKQIATLVPAYKSAMQAEGGVISAKGEAVNEVLEKDLKTVHSEFDIDMLNKTMLVLANNANAVTAAAAELSAEAFKADESLKDNKFSTSFGKNINIDAGFSREKTIVSRNPSTGEQMDPVTKHNFMTGGRFVIQGVGSKSVRQHSTQFGSELLAD